MNQSSPKKEPYTGDPSARLTICPKKQRRHLERDLGYYQIPAFTTDVDLNGERLSQEALEQAGLDKPRVIVLCKHCKGDPVIYRDTPPEEAEAVPA